MAIGRPGPGRRAGRARRAPAAKRRTAQSDFLVSRGRPQAGDESRSSGCASRPGSGQIRHIERPRRLARRTRDHSPVPHAPPPADDRADLRPLMRLRLRGAGPFREVEAAGRRTGWSDPPLGGVDAYPSHRTIAAKVTTASWFLAVFSKRVATLAELFEPASSNHQPNGARRREDAGRRLLDLAGGAVRHGLPASPEGAQTRRQTARGGHFPQPPAPPRRTADQITNCSQAPIFRSAIACFRMSSASLRV